MRINPIHSVPDPMGEWPTYLVLPKRQRDLDRPFFRSFFVVTHLNLPTQEQP